jgi:hypothetical protein
METSRAKSARQTDALDDSAATDHACFADFTDVFTLVALSGLALWRVKGKWKTPILPTILDLPQRAP